MAKRKIIKSNNNNNCMKEKLDKSYQLSTILGAIIWLIFHFVKYFLFI